MLQSGPVFWVERFEFNVFKVFLRGFDIFLKKEPTFLLLMKDVLESRREWLVWINNKFDNKCGNEIETKCLSVPLSPTTDDNLVRHFFVSSTIFQEIHNETEVIRRVTGGKY